MKSLLVFSILLTSSWALSYPNAKKIIKKIQQNSYLKYYDYETVVLDSKSGKNSAGITLIMQASTKWSYGDNITGQLAKVKKTFKKCGVHLQEVLLVYVGLTQKAYQVLNDDNPYKGPGEHKIVSAGLYRPEVYGFLLGYKNIPKLAHAYTNTFASKFPKWKMLRGTFWISQDYFTSSLVPNAGPSYTTFAHELAHIWGDIGHVSTKKPNLMNTIDNVPDSKSSYLNLLQCKNIRNNYEYSY